MRALLLALVIPIAGCDPFVAQVDEPSACLTLSAKQFTARQGGASAVVPFDVSLNGKLVQPGVTTHVSLSSVELTSQQVDFTSVTGARVRVLPTNDGAAVGGVVVSSGGAPVAKAGSLTISGSDADVFPQLSAGAAQLSIELDGALPASGFTSDVTACVHVTSEGNYL